LLFSTTHTSAVNGRADGLHPPLEIAEMIFDQEVSLDQSSKLERPEAGGL
jgi:hypothetical protein